jgi:Tol biopolymer transport system component
VAIWYGYESGPPLVVTGTVRITNDGKAKIPVLPPLTDGVHLYFVEGQPFNSGSGIAQMSITGGETTWITTSLREILAVPAISPDGSKLLVAAGFAGGPTAWSQFWIQPLPAGTPYRVGHITGISGCFTPDGSHVLYGDGRVVKIVNLDGSDPHALTSVPGILRAPRFSSDGKRIRFWLSQLEDSATSIWEMGADGSNLHPLLPDWKEATNQCCGSWSPDGNYYYFQATRGNEQSIWVLPERRSIFRRTPAPFRLISGPLRFGAPGPGTDGKTLFVLGEETRVELFRYDLKAKRFDPYLKGLSAGPIDISPDGKWIAYVSYPDMTLWSSRLDLTQKTQLTFSPVRAYEPRWSPAGSRIAFMDVRPGRPWTISVLSTAGGDSPKPIEPLNQNGSESDPTWTPDGKSIVFSKGAADGKGAHAVYSLDLDKGNLLLVPGSDQVLSPRLSPDGKFISALRIGGNSLMLFDLKNNQWSTLTEGGRFSGNEWSRDGKYVYMRANRGGAAHLMRVRIKDRALEDVLDLTDFPALADDFANWIGVTPDGGALLMRDRSVQEIYALTLEKK